MADAERSSECPPNTRPVKTKLAYATSPWSSLTRKNDVTPQLYGPICVRLSHHTEQPIPGHPNRDRAPIENQGYGTMT